MTTALDQNPLGQKIALEDTALHINRIHRQYGGLTAVDVDEIRIPRGKLTALIGPNGAGKSTLFNIVTGFDKPDDGSWAFEGTNLAGKQAHTIARLGMIRTFQMTRLISGQTVLENMLLAASRQRGDSLTRAWWRPSWKNEEAENTERARELLGRFKLADKAETDAASLSGGQRRLLEVARALMARPRAILLDEPLAGVNPALREQVMQHLTELRDAGMTILFVEHDMDAVMGLSDHVVCMALGKRIAEGTPQEVASNESVIDAYLGVHTPGNHRPPTPLAVASRSANSKVPIEPVLRVSSITAGYHPDRPILNGLDATVSAGEVVAVIGANGAGKSTLLKAVAGLVDVGSGDILVEGKSIVKQEVHLRVRNGIGYVPQSNNVFPSLTVMENLRMGGFGHRRHDDAIARVLDMFPHLKELLGTPAGSLSGGQRQSVAMARALVPRPHLLLLDEPSAGLSPMAQSAAFATVADVAESGVSILIVEQNARECLAMSHRGYVLEQGKVALSGSGQSLLADERVIELYLGAMKTKRANQLMESEKESSEHTTD